MNHRRRYELVGLDIGMVLAADRLATMMLC